MKTKTILFATIALFFIICGIGCEKDNLSYQGKVISLNTGTGCFDIIKIERSIPKGLPINSTITFNPSLYKGQLRVGDTVYFKITKYEEWTGIVLAMCVGPQYDAQLEFYQ